MKEGYSVISLGVDCRVRFQISRFFDRERAAHVPTVEPVQGLSRVAHGTNLFDWNITWLDQINSAFANRFEGLFERDNLRPLPGYPDVAVDSRYGFRFFHLFHSEGTASFEEMIDRQYAQSASKVIYLRDKLLRHLSLPNPTIYVRCDGSEVDVQRFCGIIRSTYKDHRFHVILIDMQDATTGFSTRQLDYSIYRMCRVVDKVKEKQWTGDDRQWNVLLGRLRADEFLKF